jgi:hypothetical protein
MALAIAFTPAVARRPKIGFLFAIAGRYSLRRIVRDLGRVAVT